jgi:hypothetical protein
VTRPECVVSSGPLFTVIVSVGKRMLGQESKLDPFEIDLEIGKVRCYARRLSWQKTMLARLSSKSSLSLATIYCTNQFLQLSRPSPPLIKWLLLHLPCAHPCQHAFSDRQTSISKSPHFACPPRVIQTRENIALHLFLDNINS